MSWTNCLDILVSLDKTVTKDKYQVLNSLDIKLLLPYLYEIVTQSFVHSSEGDLDNLSPEMLGS